MCIGLRSVKVPIEDIVEGLKDLDTDHDGSISVAEALAYIKKLAHRLKEC